MANDPIKQYNPDTSQWEGIRAGSISDGTNVVTPNDFVSHLADIASQAAGKGASMIGVQDVNNRFTSTNVEAVLNELFQFASNGKTDIASVIGSPATNGDTFAQLKTHIQNIKNTLAANLATKGQTAVGTETLASLTTKVGLISSSNIKSIQKGSTLVDQATINQAIASVDMTKSIVKVQYVSGGGNNQANNLVMAKLTSNTNIEFSIGNAVLPPTVYWEVIEFNNVKSIQRGEVTFSTTTNNVSLSTINESKSIHFISWKSSSASGGNSLMTVAGNITSAANLQLIQYSTENKTVAWQVVEFN